jgi:hypothetical protein
LADRIALGRAGRLRTNRVAPTARTTWPLAQEALVQQHDEPLGGLLVAFRGERHTP